MSTFRFKDISLISLKEQKARRICFHEKKNLLVGRNHTGKSSIIKNLFSTLGAAPQGKLNQWDPEAMSAVTFLVNGEVFTVLRQAQFRALFSSDLRILYTAASHAEWSEVFARLVDFKLLLTDKENRVVSGDARCFFTPFYINQDGSWQSKWDTFSGMQQYASPHKAILQYFSGIRPPEYYELESEKTILNKEADEQRREIKALSRAWEKVSTSFAMPRPIIDRALFERDLEDLAAEITALNDRQELLREEAVRQIESLSSLKQQIELASNALAGYDADWRFLVGRDTREVECPTCGSQSMAPVVELLSYAEDARLLRDMTALLASEVGKVANQHKATQAEIERLGLQHVKITNALRVRRGELSVDQVVTAFAAETAHLYQIPLMVTRAAQQAGLAGEAVI